MYYIVKINDKWRAVLYRGKPSDDMPSFIKSLGVEFGGQYGREDFAYIAVSNLNEEKR